MEIPDQEELESESELQVFHETQISNFDGSNSWVLTSIWNGILLSSNDCFIFQFDFSLNYVEINIYVNLF